VEIQAWWHTNVISALRRQRQEEHKFKTSFGGDKGGGWGKWGEKNKDQLGLHSKTLSQKNNYKVRGGGIKENDGEGEFN
jgi:hypothetical protein